MYTPSQYEALRQQLDAMVVEFNYLNGEISKLRTELKNSVSTFERRLNARDLEFAGISKEVYRLGRRRPSKAAKRVARKKK